MSRVGVALTLGAAGAPQQGVTFCPECAIDTTSDAVFRSLMGSWQMSGSVGQLEEQIAAVLRACGPIAPEREVLKTH